MSPPSRLGRAMSGRDDVSPEALARTSAAVILTDRRWSRLVLPVVAAGILLVDIAEFFVADGIDPPWPTAFVLCAALALQGWWQVPALIVSVLVQASSSFWGVDTPGMSVVVPLVGLFEVISTGRVKAGAICSVVFLLVLLTPRDISPDTWLEWAMLTVIVNVFGVSWWRGRLLQAAAVTRAKAAVADADAARTALTSARTDLARDLHDLSAADLSRLVILAQSHAWSTPEDTEHAERVADEARCALLHMRMLMSTLDAPAGAGAGSIEDTLTSARTYLGVRGIDLVTDTDDDVETVPAAARILLRSVLVELTTNAFKHAREDSVMTVSMGVDDGTIRVRATSRLGERSPVAGDGVLSGGSGLRRMTARLQGVGGIADVRRDEDHWIVEAGFPVDLDDHR